VKEKNKRIKKQFEEEKSQMGIKIFKTKKFKKILERILLFFK
jgi:hypothetical protein